MYPIMNQGLARLLTLLLKIPGHILMGSTEFIALSVPSMKIWKVIITFRGLQSSCWRLVSSNWRDILCSSNFLRSQSVSFYNRSVFVSPYGTLSKQGKSVGSYLLGKTKFARTIKFPSSKIIANWYLMLFFIRMTFLPLINWIFSWKGRESVRNWSLPCTMSEIQLETTSLDGLEWK